MIRVGGESGWAPFDFVDSNHNYTAICYEYLKILADQTHLSFKIEIDRWDVLLDKLKNKQIDLLPALYFSNDRSAYINFTDQPYHNVVDYIFMRDDSGFKSVNDLQGKTLAVKKGYATIDRIKTAIPGIKILPVASPSAAINAVITHQADILYDSLATMSYFLKTNSYVKFMASHLFP